jgi:hypothetical protein
VGPVGFVPWKHSFKIRPGLVGRSETRPIRGWNRVRLKKKQGKEKPGVTRLTQQDPVKNPVATR